MLAARLPVDLPGDEAAGADRHVGSNRSPTRSVPKVQKRSPRRKDVSRVADEIDREHLDASFRSHASSTASFSALDLSPIASTGTLPIQGVAVAARAWAADRMASTGSPAWAQSVARSK